MQEKFQTRARRVPTWKEIGEFLGRFGWFAQEIKPGRIVFERGSRQIVAFKTITGKWKVEYFVNQRLYDTAGITDEKHARVLAAEIGLLRW